MLHYNPLFVCVLEQKQEWLLLFWLTNLQAENPGPARGRVYSSFASPPGPIESS